MRPPLAPKEVANSWNAQVSDGEEAGGKAGDVEKRRVTVGKDPVREHADHPERDGVRNTETPPREPGQLT